MPRPTTRPSWIGSRREPSDAQKLDGFRANQTPPAEWLNWVLGKPSDWLDYIDDWIQTVATPEADALEQALEMQSVFPAREVAASTVTMQINACAAAVNAAGALLHAVGVGASGIIIRYDAVRTETTHPTAAAALTLNDVIYANGQYVAVGANGSVQTSPDGITWTARGAINVAYQLQSIAYGGGRYVAVAVDGGNSGWSFDSADAITWSAAVSWGGGFLTRIVWAGGTHNKFFAFGATFVKSSPATPVAWTTVHNASGNSRLFDAVWHPTLGFVSLSMPTSPAGQLRISASVNGTTWTVANSTTNYVTSTSAFALMPFNKSIAVCYSVSPTSYLTAVMFMLDFSQAPQPTTLPRVLPAIYAGAVGRVKLAQSTWFGAFNISATQARIVCGQPVETLRGLLP